MAVPVTLLLEAIKATLDQVDYQAEAGIAGVTVRHRRNRFSIDSELPCIAIQWISDEIVDEETPYLTAWEKTRGLTVDLVIDSLIDDEESGLDPTANQALLNLAAASIRALKKDDSPLGALSETRSLRDMAADEDSKEDKGRLVATLFVVYRVRVDDETVLLAEGINA